MTVQGTKDKIIEAGAEIIHRKGFNHTGIQEVLAAANVPKGSFYFHFINKEDFGLHVIDYFNELYLDTLKPILENKTLTPLNKIEQVFDFYIHLFQALDFTCGCPIGNLSQEMSDLSDAFRKKLNTAIRIMANSYRMLLIQAQKRNEISRRIQTQEMADFIVSSWHGSLIRMKIEKSIHPLRIHRQFILNILKAEEI